MSSPPIIRTTFFNHNSPQHPKVGVFGLGIELKGLIASDLYGAAQYQDPIAAANKKAKGVKGGASFLLTPEATRVANNFTANKGKLIWPLEKGLLKRGYGVYSDPVYPGIKHQNNGVTIATEKGSQARAIFEGEVRKRKMIF